MFAVVIESLLYFCDKTYVHDLKIKECEGGGSLCPLEIHSLSPPVAPEPASTGPQAQVSLTLRESPLASLHNTWRAGARDTGRTQGTEPGCVRTVHKQASWMLDPSVFHHVTLC